MHIGRIVLAILRNDDVDTAGIKNNTRATMEYDDVLFVKHASQTPYFSVFTFQFSV